MNPNRMTKAEMSELLNQLEADKAKLQTRLDQLETTDRYSTAWQNKAGKSANNPDGPKVWMQVRITEPGIYRFAGFVPAEEKINRNNEKAVLNFEINKVRDLEVAS
jgi:hypothetical protein